MSTAYDLSHGVGGFRSRPTDDLGVSNASDLSSSSSVGAVFENWFSPGTAQAKENAYQAMIDREYNSREAEIARQFSAQEAQKQRDYEERLSNTAYQRAVSDLRAAGLNPYAVYGGASAAAVPTGSAGSAYQAHSSGSRVSKGSSGVVSLLGTAISVLGKLL